MPSHGEEEQHYQSKPLIRMESEGAHKICPKTDPPSAKLSPQLSMVTAMAVTDHGTRFINELETGLEHSEKHFHVSASLGNGPDIERCIKGTNPSKHLPSEGHVCPGSHLKDPSMKSRHPRFALTIFSVRPLHKTAPEPTTALKKNLRFGFKLIGYNQSCDGHDFCIFDKDGNKCTDPPWVDDDVVIRVSDNLTVGLVNDPVTCPVQAGTGFQDVTNIWIIPANQQPGSLTARGVINEE
jgi:hypothetical protein